MAEAAAPLAAEKGKQQHEAVPPSEFLVPHSAQTSLGCNDYGRSRQRCNDTSDSVIS